MKHLKEFSVIETSDAIISIIGIDDNNVTGFHYDKTTYIDSTTSIDMTDVDFTVIAETSTIVEVTEAYNDYIKSL